MIALALLLAAAPDADPRTRFEACAALVKTDPAKAAADANGWREANGGVPAGQCLGLAYAAQEKWAEAALAFEQAAGVAERDRDGRAAILWVQAGNAALAGEDHGRARDDLDKAVALSDLSPVQTGEALLDRCRAKVALGDLVAARTDMDQALSLVPQDPMAWLLSATLARRQSEGARALKDIAEAKRLAPDAPAVVFEDGNIAKLQGDMAAAKAAWTRAKALDPNDPAAQAAAAALAAAP